MASHDPMANLTIAELDSGSRLLKTDIVTAITNDTQDRWQGLAIIAWLHARRVDPKARLETYRAMTSTELMAQLGIGVDDDEQADGRAPADDDGAPDGTTGDAPVDTVDDPVDAVAADPTESAPAS